MTRSVRVLVADDVAVSKELAPALAKRGYEVEAVATGREALDRMRNSSFDVVLVNMPPPDANGAALLHSLRDLRPDVALIVVTDHPSAEEVPPAVQETASWWVTRPVAVRQLSERIPAVLERQRLLADKRRMQEAVLNAAQEWRTTIDAIADPVSLLDLDGKVTRCNKAMAELVGQPFEAILGRTCWELVHGETGPVEGCPLLRMQASGHRESLVLQHDDRWFNVVCDPVCDEDGGVVGAVHVMSDITYQKRGEALKDSLHAISEAAHTARSLREVLSLIHEIINRLLPARNFSVALYDAEEDLLSFPYCVDERAEPPGQRRPARGLTEYVLRTGRALLASREVSERLVREGEVAIVGTPAIEWVGVPLKQGGRTTGVLAVQSYEEGVRFGRDAESILTFVSEQVAMSIERMRAEEELRQSYETLQGAMEGIVQAMAVAAEMRDPYTAGHQRRVTRLACALAEKLHLAQDRIEGIRMAGLIHDIGKMHVPVEILSKPGRLNGLEFGLIKDHPTVGHDVLKDIAFPWPIAQIVFQHHERVDGSGYPRGLLGEETLLEARIIAVADVVEAMSSDRPYRPALGIDAALAEIQEYRGTLYDKRVVDACLKVFAEDGFAFDGEQGPVAESGA